MKKITILIISIFLLSGCTLNYEMKINSENEVVENVTLNIPVENEINKDEIELSFDTIKNSYDLKTNYEKITYTDNNISINIANISQNIEDFFDNSNIYNYMNNIFKYINIYQKDSNYEVVLNGISDNFESMDSKINKFNVVIKSPLKLQNHNADKENIITGTYKWEFDQDTDEDKTIEFVLTDKQNYIAIFYNNYTVVFYIVVIILGSLAAFGIYKLYLKAYK